MKREEVREALKELKKVKIFEYEEGKEILSGICEKYKDKYPKFIKDREEYRELCSFFEISRTYKETHIYDEWSREHIFTIREGKDKSWWIFPI